MRFFVYNELVTGNTTIRCCLLCGAALEIYERGKATMYSALDLASKILGICGEDKAQAIVDIIKGSLVMPID